MAQRKEQGYIITQSVKVKDSEFVLGHHPYNGKYVTWLCKNEEDYCYGHYFDNYYGALKDLCQRITDEIDCMVSKGVIPPLSN